MNDLRIFLCLVGIFSMTHLAQAQWDVAGECQVYPTGVIPGVNVAYNFSDRWAVSGRIGYQFIDHRDLGKNINEEGHGVGGSLAIKRYLNPSHSKMSLALKTDVWANTIDWESVNEVDLFIKGTSKVTVLQPTLELGYLFTLGQSSWFVTPTAAFGFEWNVSTDGRETGEGAIFLLGVQLGYRI